MAAGQDAAQAAAEATQPKVMCESQPDGQADARRIGINLPGMNRQHGG